MTTTDGRADRLKLYSILTLIAAVFTAILLAVAWFGAGRQLRGAHYAMAGIILFLVGASILCRVLEDRLAWSTTDRAHRMAAAFAAAETEARAAIAKREAEDQADLQRATALAAQALGQPADRADYVEPPRVDPAPGGLRPELRRRARYSAPAVTS